jgi:xanthine dehydrogenase accessory factor
LRSVDEAPNGTHFLVMTHSHPLDYDLCRGILLREDFAWAGVIGSRSKSARFRSQLARDGLTAAQIARLTCPIGIDGIDSKSPGVIAVAVAAQLLQTFESAARAPAGTGLPAASAGCVARGLSHTACASCGFSQSTPQ